MRVGIGFDIHRLVSRRSLWLGGVKIPSGKGLQGHSDADVVLHAVCDALLGAVGKGDMGIYFPDTDSRWKGASSRTFIAKARQELASRKLAVANLDLVVIAEHPKLSPHRKAIEDSVAKLLKIPSHRVNLKAKTMEGLGEIGKSQAIAAYAAVLLEER